MSFLYHHIPPLFIATCFVPGGLIPFFSGARAIKEYGLPPHIQNSGEAQVVMQIYGSRATAMGICLFMLYKQRMFQAMDTLMFCIGITGYFDGYINWMEGAKSNAIFRMSVATAVGAWGWFGMTSNE